MMPGLLIRDLDPGLRRQLEERAKAHGRSLSDVRAVGVGPPGFSQADVGRMIILDANVVSEGFRPRPSDAVRHRLDAQRAADLWPCAPVPAELRFGVELLPPGPRRADLDRANTAAEADLFGGRVPSFDRDCAHVFGRIVAARRSAGRTIAAMDAAIALTHHLAIATRNVTDFSDLGLELIDPFEPRSGAA